MSTPPSVVPGYPTLASFVRAGRVNADWHAWFPFNAPGGWAFSGRVALYQGLPSLRLPPASTILVPSYHEGVELDTLLAAGHRLRYYRVDEALRINLADVERRLDASVSALYVIHYFGFPQSLTALRSFCDAHGLRLIEDCALSLFSRADGTWLGSVGDLALFSVYKTLPLPHGGFMATKAPRSAAALAPAPRFSTLAQALDLLHQGVEASAWWRLEKWWTRASRRAARMIRWQRDGIVASGGARWDSRLLDYGASPWIVPLMRFMDRDAVIARRRANYERLASRLRGHVSFPFPELRAGTCPLFFPVMVPEKVRFQQELERLGVQSVNLWDASHPTCPPALAAEVRPCAVHSLSLPSPRDLGEGKVDGSPPPSSMSSARPSRPRPGLGGSLEQPPAQFIDGSGWPRPAYVLNPVFIS